MEKYLIIADDFTGSNDTGVQLSRRGIGTKVVLEAAGIKNDGFSYVLDTESRNIPAGRAAAKTAELLANVDMSAFDCVIKKVDSTLRGNIAQEIQETDRAYGSELVIFMPALPGLGRTTVKGIHMLAGRRILETELAKDPRKPVTEDNIAAILQSVYDEDIRLIDIDSIRGGRIDLHGARLFACDAETDDDMRAVIGEAKKVGRRVLWVGTAAMADNLMFDLHPSLPALALVASVSDTMRTQLHYAAEKGLDMVKLDVPALIRGEDENSRDRVIALLKAGKNAAFVSSASWDREELDASVAAGAEKGMTPEQVAEFACTAITKLAVSILDEISVSGLFISGGDTAIHFFSQAGADGSEIRSELSVGIPMMRLSGGKFDGLKVITKAGAFGSPDVLPGIMRKLGES